MAASLKDMEERFDALVAGTDGPVPKAVVRNFLFAALDLNTGMPAAKDAPQSRIFVYAPEKIGRVLDLAENLLKRVDSLPSHEIPRLLFSGGGPGVGKTTDLIQAAVERYGKNLQLPSKAWAEPSLAEVVETSFLSPMGLPATLMSADRLGLYLLAKEDHGTPTVDKEFYIANRAAGNALSMISGNAAFAKRQDVVWDTTMGSGSNIFTLKYAHDNKYVSDGRGVGSDLETRLAAIEARNVTGAFFQSLDVNLDAQDKGYRDVFPQMFSYINSFTVLWRDQADAKPVEGAVVRPSDGAIAVINRAAYDNYAKLYPQIRELPYAERPDRRRNDANMKPQLKL